MCKLIEKPVCIQPKKYLFDNTLYAKCQSAYRVGHSTETEIFRVHNDVKCLLDRRRVAILIMLDLSAVLTQLTTTYVCTDYTRFGINGTALKWFSSYLNCGSSEGYVRAKSNL